MVTGRSLNANEWCNKPCLTSNEFKSIEDIVAGELSIAWRQENYPDEPFGGILQTVCL